MDGFRKTLYEHGGRLTRERTLLVQTICGLGRHFSPEDVEQALAAAGHPVALTTIYRNLPLLMEAGIVSRGYFEDRQGLRYEHVWGEKHHDHLVCSSCDKVVEFHYPAINVLQETIAAEHGFKLKRHLQVLVGTCADCLARADEGEHAHE